MNGSLAFALTTVLLWWLVLYALYRRRWFFKL
jgi:predicted acyltransferase